ncbi:MAG: chemotaxis protein CheW [Burkholderiales bacterium]
MTEKSSLREYQAAVSERLKNAASQGESTTSMLGFIAAGQNWLIELRQVSEVLPVPMLEPVPLTREYFLGVCNVRGNLYSVVDFTLLNDKAALKPSPENRLLLLPHDAIHGAAIQVTRMAGLRNPDTFRHEAAPADAQPWVASVLRDAEGQPWNVLNPEALARHQKFLDVAA